MKPCTYATICINIDLTSEVSNRKVTAFLEVRLVS